MFDRENLLGWVLLATCALAGGILLWSTVTDRPLVYTGPTWLPPVLGVAYLAGVIYLWFNGSGQRWLARRSTDPVLGGGMRKRKQDAASQHPPKGDDAPRP